MAGYGRDYGSRRERGFGGRSRGRRSSGAERPAAGNRPPDYYGGARYYRGYEVDDRDRRYMGGVGRYGTMRGYDVTGGFEGRRLRPELRGRGRYGMDLGPNRAGGRRGGPAPAPWWGVGEGRR